MSRCVMRVLVCAGVVLCCLPLFAHSAASPGTDEPGTGVDNGVDPLYFRHRVELEARTFDAEEFDVDRGYTASFRVDWAVTSADIFRLVVPYSHFDYDNGDSSNDFGDMELRFLRKVDRSSSEHYLDAIGFGVDLVIPTGDLGDRTGRAQWSVAPVLMASAYPGHGVGIFPEFRFVKSISHDEPGAEQVVELDASALFTWNHPRWWIALEPEMIWDFSGGDNSSYALRFQAGMQLGRHFALLAAVGTTLGGSKERFDDEALLSLRFLP